MIDILFQFNITAVFGIINNSCPRCFRTKFKPLKNCPIILFIILGIGVSLEVTANLIPLPGEGLILSICTVLPIKFGNMKVITDVSLVVAAVLLSFIFLADLYGVREGTIAAAICVGLVSKMVIRLIGPYQRWLTS